MGVAGMTKHGGGPQSTREVTELRHQLCAAGFVPLPLMGKAPVLKGWQKRTDASPGDIEIWEKLFPAALNTGALTAHMPALDVDITNPMAAEAIEALARERYEERGYICTRIGKAPKRAILFRTDAPFAKIIANLVGPNGGTDQKLEMLANGQQIVISGIHPDTHKPYAWHGGTPGQIRREDLPYITADEARALIDDAAELLVREFGYTRRRHKSNGPDAPAERGTDWAPLVNNIASGCELHGSLRDAAAKLVVGGMTEGAAVNLLRALMETSTAPRDGRFAQRLAEIRAPWRARGRSSAKRRTGEAQPPVTLRA
jgi:hypothetical protein